MEEYNFKGRIIVQKNFGKLPKERKKPPVVIKKPKERPIGINIEQLILLQQEDNRLKASVNRETYNLIKYGILQVLPIKKSYEITILNRLKRPIKHDLIEISNGYGSNHTFIAFFRGYYFSEHTHYITIENDKILIEKGQLMLKFGDQII